MNIVYYGKETYQTPSAWNELSKKQLLKIIDVFYAQISEVKGFLLILQTLTRMPWWKMFAAKTPYIEQASKEASMFLMEKNDLTKNLIPFYRMKAGPADHLRNLKGGEFCFTEIFFSRWKNEQDDQFLDKLVAVLYRSPRIFYNHFLNAEGDHRSEFNPNLIDRYTRSVAAWPRNVKLAIAHFYEGCRNEKIAQNPKVFEGGGGDESLHGMWSVMRNVAKAGHFGDLDNVLNQYVDTILMELNEVVVEAEKQEAEMKKRK